MTSIVLAGGGTAGHTSPLIATAKAILDREPGAGIVAIGTAKGLETTVVPAAGLELRLIDPVPLPRTINLDLAKLPYTLTRSVLQARRILKATRADALVGFGGYVSIPAYLAAKMAGVPIIVHEANKLPGIANKVGVRWARYVGTTFAETTMPRGSLIGLPMRRSITNPTVTAAEARESFGLDPDRPTLLVSGGSQGARSINQALETAVPRILAAGIQILHVLGAKNFGPDNVDITGDGGATYHPVAYVEDMAVAYAAADLMVGRAGAGTVVETAVSGVPVIFVPLPYGNGEQARNAAELVAEGAGVLVSDDELSPDRLASLVLEIFGDPERLTHMQDTARGTYPADAADVLADAVLQVATS